MLTHYQKIFKRKIFILIFFSIITLYSYYLFNYDISRQHDVWLHHYYIFNILKFNFTEINSEYGFFYYFYTSCFSIFTYPIHYFQLLEDREVFYLTIRLSNLSLLTLTLFLINKISEKIFLFNNEQKTLIFLLCFSFGFFNKTFFMARPENLMIPLSLIIILEIHKIFEQNKINLKVILPTLCILSAQKVSGLIFSLVIITFVFLKKKDNECYKLLFLFIFGLIILYFLHYLITGVKFYENSDRLFDNTDSLGLINNLEKIYIIFKFSLLDAWNNPLRDFQKHSMINILSIEMVGDYWKYGVHNLKNLKIDENCLIFLNRISIIFFIVFIFFLTSIIINFLNLDNKFSLSRNLIICLNFLLLFSGIGVLILAVFFRASLVDLDIVKFEYISYFLIPIIFNLIEFSKKHIIYKIAVYFLISVGLYNNLFPIHCII